MAHLRVGKCVMAELSLLVIAGGVRGATRDASASGVVAARGPVVGAHPSPEHELGVPVCALAVVVETAEPKGLERLQADAASPGRLRYSTGADGEHQMANPLMAQPVPLTDLLQGLTAGVLTDHERIPGGQGCVEGPAGPGE
jgi:hypothetical protein